MPFIRTQKIVYDEQHRIVSGSASIVDVKYVPSQGKAHSYVSLSSRKAPNIRHL